MQDLTNVKTTEVKGEVVKNDAWMHSLPQELSSLMPESAWVSLSLEDKKDILRKNNLFEKYVVSSVEPVSAEVPTDIDTSSVKPPEVVVENANIEIPEAEQFQEQVAKAKEVEKGFEQEQALSQEEKQRIGEETVVQANTQTGTTVRVFGYSVTQNTAQNAKQISDNGDVNDGKTWAATLIKKIFAIFG